LNTYQNNNIIYNTDSQSLSFSDSTAEEKGNILKKVVPAIKKVIPVAQKNVTIAGVIIS
jgi:hypothetical protein